MASSIPKADLESFSDRLQKSIRILALLGAGLSAASGLPTFRGAGGIWRRHDATSLATPEAFSDDPALVWQFYSYRRHMALQAKPNPAHFALAKLAHKKKDFITLSQNVDGLSQRAGHRASQLHLLHGSLFDVNCTSFFCSYSEQNNFVDPIVPALAIPERGPQPAPIGTETDGQKATDLLYEAMDAVSSNEADISDHRIPVPDVKVSDLPQCPECGNGLLRPGVVWFGEALPRKTMDVVDAFMDQPEKIDLMLVIGTSAVVYPAASYVYAARKKGARVAVINTDKHDARDLEPGDWFFEGDAGIIVPEILKSVIGDISETTEKTAKSHKDLRKEKVKTSS